MIELKAPFMVDFEVTNACPYRCPFCEANLGQIDPVPELSTDKCFSVLDAIAEAGVFGVFLTGGEPFVRSDLPTLIKHCFEVGLEPTVSTNGMYLSDKNIEAVMNAGLTYLQVSIHGYGDIHDSLVRVRGAYSYVLHNLEKAIQAKLDVEVACVGLEKNFSTIPALLYDLSSVGVKRFRILRLLASHSAHILSQIPSRQTIMNYMPEIEKVARECGISLTASFCPGLNPGAGVIYQDIHPMAITCSAGKTECAILPNGDVYPCVNLKDSPAMRVGNILQTPLKDLWNHPIMVELRRLTPDDYTGICGKCEMKYACYSARCVAFNLTGSIYGDDLSCYIIRENPRES
jgi:radical SAM protein with 4Fe4S-binding SPASM domain